MWLSPSLCFSYCSYSKTEGLEHGSTEMLEFNFLLVSTGDYHHYQESHDLVGRAEGLGGLVFSYTQFPLVNMVLEDKILILARKGSGCNEN